MLKITRSCTAALMFIAPPMLLAQETGNTGRPGANVPRVDEAPVIDGDLSDAVWSRASVIRSMTEVDPDEGAPADPPTEILLMRDDEHLYVGFICYEPEIDRLVLIDMHREGMQMEDDAVKITVDTFRDGKSGYYFLVSAAGSRLDALVADNGQRLNYNWDGFWEGRVKILADRWTTEFAIPFKTMAFGRQEIWGANFERYRGTDRSRYRWTGHEREYRVTTVSEGGDLFIRDGLNQGLGLEFLPYFKVKYDREHEPRDADTLGDLGGEASWRITPQLTGSFTVNTDFAETEVDQRRVNLTRFPLFFPEKRDFFLQDSTLFEFGASSRGFGGSPDLIPYHSRRIGLSPGGDEIPIDYGGRVAGRVGDLDLGFLAVRTGENGAEGEDIPAGELVVARPSYRVTDELTVGGILTSGNPASRDNNWVGGGDIRYVSTNLLPGLFSLDTYALHSDDEAEAVEGSAYGVKSSLKTSNWYYMLETLYSQDEFIPALGFVRRPGERRYAGQIEWSPRPESKHIRNYEFSFEPSFWTEPDGTIISKNLETQLFGVEWHSGDQFSIDHEVESDRLDEDFEPVDGSIIPAGEYDWQAIGASFRFSEKRKLSGDIGVDGGGWYNGRQIRYSASGSWNPSPNLELGLGYSESRFRIPGENFTTRIETFRVNYDFSPDMRIETLVQADNVSDNVGLQSRFRWIIEDGRELFFVVNSSWLKEEDDDIVPVKQDYTVKLEYALRF